MFVRNLIAKFTTLAIVNALPASTSPAVYVANADMNIKTLTHNVFD